MKPPFTKSISEIDQINFKKVGMIMNQALIEKVAFRFNLFCELPKVIPATGPERYYAKGASVIDGKEIHFLLVYHINSSVADKPYSIWSYPNTQKSRDFLAKLPL